MQTLIVILLLIIIGLLLRINSKLPRRDLATEAVERYHEERSKDK
ncbi:MULTISPECIES: hypothetical protein [Bacillales]|nr:MULTISPECIES: hypothetical protein [Bacillales]